MNRIECECSDGFRKKLGKTLRTSKFINSDFFIASALDVVKQEDISSFIIVSTTEIGVDVETSVGDFSVSNNLYDAVNGVFENLVDQMNFMLDDLATLNIYRKTYKQISQTVCNVAKNNLTPNQGIEKIDECITNVAEQNDCLEEANNVVNTYREYILKILNLLDKDAYDEYAIGRVR